MVPLLFSENPATQYAATWALFVVGHSRIWAPPAEPDVFGRLFALWQHSPIERMRKAFAETIANQYLSPHDYGHRCASINRQEFSAVFKKYEKLDSFYEKPAALIVAWYLGALSKVDLAQHIRELIRAGRQDVSGTPLNDILEQLGERREEEK